MRTVRVTDRDEPRIIYTYSAEPIDYVLGTQYVLESVEQVMQTQRLRATGVYVPEAANDNGETCHPMHLRAERFGLRGALYRRLTTYMDTNISGTSGSYSCMDQRCSTSRTTT